MDESALSRVSETLLALMSAARSAQDEIRVFKGRRHSAREVQEVVPRRMRATALRAVRTLKLAAMEAGAQERIARQRAKAAALALTDKSVSPGLFAQVSPAVDSLLDACDVVDSLKNEAFEVAEAIREELGLPNAMNWMDSPL